MTEEKEKIRKYLIFFQRIKRESNPQYVIDQVLDAMPEDPEERKLFLIAMDIHGYGLTFKTHAMQFSESGMLPARLV